MLLNMKTKKVEKVITTLKDRIGQPLRLLFVFATEYALLRMFLDIWRQILFPGDLHDDAL